MAWSMNVMIDTFEDMLGKWSKNCSTGGSGNIRASPHRGVKQRIFNVNHVAVGYLCDFCFSGFQDEWNTLLPQKDETYSTLRKENGVWVMD